MPYINIKGYPKDIETKKKVAQEINNIFIKEWGCAPEAITIAIEEVDPKNWQTDVVDTLIEKKKDNAFILNGEIVKWV